jgi:hypothetical protein
VVALHGFPEFWYGRHRQIAPLVPELADRSLTHCDRGRLERFPDVSHWVNHEYPNRVTDLLADPDALLIRGEYRTGSDTGGIDNAELSA